MSDYGPIIDGVVTFNEDSFDVVDPTTSEPYQTVDAADEALVEEAVAVGHTSFDTWSELSPDRRRRGLLELAAAIRDNRERLVDVLVAETGKPVSDARAEVAEVADTFEYYAGFTDKIHGKTLSTQSDRLGYTLTKPYGVTAHIVPWNYPMLLATRSFAPALATGNAAVIKPPSEAPLNLLELGELVENTSIPTGLVNFVPGPGSVVGNALAQSEGVSTISFTGSTTVGVNVMKSAADHVNPVTLELGGKSPAIVFSDAAFDEAVSGVTSGIFTNAGQNCIATSRLFVQSEIKDEFVDAVVAETESLVVGNDREMDTDADMGPMISESQLESVLEYIEVGKKEDTMLRTGGNRLTGPEYDDGFYLEPTIFDEVDPDSRIAQEEIFGPVLSVIPFEDEETMLRHANSTQFGLSSSVWTSDVDTATRVAAELEVGTCFVNTTPLTFPDLPLGGWKESGIGRSGSENGIEEHVQTKSVYIDRS
jgi:acyl-CoA reductase-like NAD-dependent aldehyde dehydrogenase